MDSRAERRIISKLPTKTAAIMRRLIANPAGERWLEVDGIEGWVVANDKAQRDVLKLAGEALVSVDFPTALVPVLADTLTANQRRVAELLAYRAGVYAVGRAAMPSKAWVRRRWLGLEKLGRLDKSITFAHEGRRVRKPLWQALHLVGAAALRDQLSLRQRLDVYGDLVHDPYGLTCSRGWVELDEVGTEGKTWARRTADRWVALWSHDMLDWERGPFRSDFRLVLYLTLVRTGARLKPEWDFLVPVIERLAGVKSAAPHRASKECLAALPAARRNAVLAAATEKNRSAGHAVQVGMKFIRTFPSEVFARALLAKLEEGRPPPAGALKTMRTVARRSAGVEAALAVHEGRVPAAAKLRRAKLVKPKSPSRLTPMQKKQLVKAGKLWDGERRSVDDRLRKPDARGMRRDGSVHGSLEIWTIEDVGGATYDFFYDAPDTGTVFAANTTRVVAHVVHRGVNCSDATLRLGLISLLTPDRPSRRKPRKRKR